MLIFWLESRKIKVKYKDKYKNDQTFWISLTDYSFSLAKEST